MSRGIVGRMIDHGFIELTWLTATELNGRLEGMEPILRELAQNDNPKIAGSVVRHSANGNELGRPIAHIGPHARP